MQKGSRRWRPAIKLALRDTVEKLWKLLPTDPELRRRGYDSGVR